MASKSMERRRVLQVCSCPSFWGQLGFSVPLLGWWMPSLQPAISRTGVVPRAGCWEASRLGWCWRR